MQNSRTIETINKFYALLEKQEFSEEEREFTCQFELELAKVMLNEFNKDMVNKLAKILLVETE